MSEMVGQVNPDYTSGRITPDVYFVKRNPVLLNRQARFLEASGMGELLGKVVKKTPETSFYYSDMVGIYPDGIRPGYVIQNEKGLAVIVSSTGKELEVSSVCHEGNTTSYRHGGPIIVPTDGKFDPSSTLSYLQTVGLIPTSLISIH